MSWRSLLVLTCLFAMLLAALAWCCWPPVAAAPAGDDDPQPAAPPMTVADPARAQTADDELSPQAPASNERTVAPPPTLRIALVGLHPERPWTGQLHVELQDRRRPYTHGELQFDLTVEHGRAAFVLPEWWHAGYPTKLRIQGRNDGYRDLGFRLKGPLSIDAELPIPVEPVAELHGTVRDVHGQPIEHARVTALQRAEAGKARAVARGETGTDAEGRFRLLATPDVPLDIVVCAMKPNVMRWRRMDGVTDNGEARGDLLPASRPVTLAMRTPHSGFDIVLQAAAIVSGTVARADGTPFEHAQVGYEAGTGDAFALGHSTNLMRRPDGSLFLNGVTYTDENGHFRVPLPHGVTATVWLAGLPKIRILDAFDKHRLRGPDRLALVVPRPITLRITDDGEPVSRAHVSFERGLDLRAERNGELALILSRRARARVQANGNSSAWLPLSPEQAGQTIELQYPR